MTAKEKYLAVNCSIYDTYIKHIIKNYIMENMRGQWFIKKKIPKDTINEQSQEKEKL